MNAKRHMANSREAGGFKSTRRAIVCTPRSTRAMTLLELIAAMVVIGLMLGGLVGVCDALANDSAQQQTLMTMRTLSHSLSVYAAAHQSDPPAEEPRNIGTPMARCIAALRSSPATGHLVVDLPGLTYTDGGWFTVYDGFGNPMLYVDPNDGVNAMVQHVRSFPRSPKGRPFVVSAGPDGRFGDLSSDDPQQRADASDNIYSFDLETGP